MYSKTRFREVLEALPRGVFDRLVAQQQADKYNKGFRCWDQLIAMVYGHISGCKSLRELEASFNEQAHHHYHLGTRALKRSTLSDANRQRSSDVFAQTCHWLMQGAHRSLKKDVKPLLYLLDSSVITLRGLGFDSWAKRVKGSINQGIKLHLMIEGASAIPSAALLSGCDVSDIKIGRTLAIEKGAIYVFDKGYYDYNWWYSLHSAGATFVTRFKKNAKADIVEQRSLAGCGETILDDALVRFTNRRVKSKREKNHYYDTPVRRITVARCDHDTPLVLVTNDTTLPADEIAQLYKQRWGIELFFKWIKQNLKLTTFFGRSENAVRIQIYTALIAYLLLRDYHSRKGVKVSLKLCLSGLKHSLFQRSDTDYLMAKRGRIRRKEISQRQPDLGFT